MEKFCEIEWNRSDIADILLENEIEPSEENVNVFIESMDTRYFEEQCIQYGMEMLYTRMDELKSLYK